MPRWPVPMLRLLVCATVLGGGASAARAFEGERVVSLGVDYSTWRLGGTLNGKDTTFIGHGGQLAFDAQRGLNDSFWARASVVGGVHAVEGELGYGGIASVGLTYAFDVLRYVPYAQLGLGAMVVGGGPADLTVKPVVEAGVGLTILESRQRSWGVVFRFDALSTDALFFSAGLRLDWRWGFF